MILNALGAPFGSLWTTVQTENPEIVKRRMFLRALSEAKSQVYEALHYAKELGLEYEENRLYHAYNGMERMFLDERDYHWNLKVEDLLDKEYGTRIK